MYCTMCLILIFVPKVDRADLSEADPTHSCMLYTVMSICIQHVTQVALLDIFEFHTSPPELSVLKTFSVSLFY